MEWGAEGHSAALMAQAHGPRWRDQKAECRAIGLRMSMSPAGFTFVGWLACDDAARQFALGAEGCQDGIWSERT